MGTKIGKTGIMAFGVILMLFAMVIPSALAAANDVTVTAPTTGANWSGSQTITWTCNTNDSVNDSFYVYYSATGATPWTVIASNLSNISLSTTWNTAAGGITDGSSYKINVTKANTNASVGNVSGLTGAFTVDNLAPVVAITMTSSGIRGSYVDTVSSTLTFSGTMTDATSGNKNISVGGSAGTLTADTWITTGVSISDGCNVVTAIGYDWAGNSHSVTKTVCKSKAKTGSSYVPTPTPVIVLPGQPPLAAIPPGDDEAIPDDVKLVGVIAIILLVVVAIWRWWK